MRSLSKILDQLLEVIPASEVSLREILEWERTDALFRAPEVVSANWRDVAEILQQHLPSETKDFNGWQNKIVAIFNPDYKEPVAE